MKLLLGLVVLVCAALTTAACSEYDITILDERTPNALYRPEWDPPAKLVGKTMAAIFGPIREIRVESEGMNLTGIEKDHNTLGEKIRTRIDHAKCVGRASEVAWHMAPWLRGYVLFENGRILPVDFLLDAFVVGDLLFSENARGE
jgi:hypothetical protein